jgi:hypothetical protein
VNFFTNLQLIFSESCSLKWRFNPFAICLIIITKLGAKLAYFVKKQALMDKRDM